MLHTLFPLHLDLQMGKFQFATESKSKHSQYKSPAQLLYQSKSVKPAASLFNHSTYSHVALLNGTSPNDQKTRKRRKKSQRMRRCLAVCVCKQQKQGEHCYSLSSAVRHFFCVCAMNKHCQKTKS